MDRLDDLRRAIPLLAAMVLLALPWHPARAETTACTVVSSLPTTISAAGTYCLDQDFDFTDSGTPININASNVVLDCNHHRVTNVGAPGSYNGVYAYNELKGVVIRNCTLDAFGGGIYLSSGSSPGATGNLIEGNAILHSGAYGITVWGNNNRIERNRVSGNTGADNGQAEGIVVYGMGNDGTSNAIRDNVISDFKPPLPTSTVFRTVGISFDGGNNFEVTGNTITGLYAPTGRAVNAIVSGGTASSLVARNIVLSPPPLPAPLDGTQDFGIVLYGGNGTNVCRDNVVGHFTSANLSGCVDSVNTDF
jgi:hypothetical protein